MSTKAPQPKRLLFVDTLRGLAVLCMIQLHTSHGWLQLEARSGDTWNAAQFFGGLAAPLFLLLAGAGLGMQWSHPNEAGRQGATRKSVARGLELVILGYLLRLQMWIVDGGAYGRLATYPALILLGAGYGLAYHSVTRLASGSRSVAWPAISSALTCLAGLLWAYRFDPTRADGLVRVDVLQCIGASLVILSLLGATSTQRRASFFIALAVCVGLATPSVQGRVPGPLPDALAGYLAQWPSAQGQRVISLFPLFPWLSFAASGVAVGLTWGRSQGVVLELRLMRLVAAGAVLALLTSDGWGALRWVELPTPVNALFRVLYKTALCFVMVGPAVAFARTPPAIHAPLKLLGRTSLMVYWVHLEFAFGIASRPVAKTLEVGGWACGTLLLATAMWALAAVRRAKHTYVLPWWRGPTAAG